MHLSENSENRSIKLMLVDDQKIFLEGLAYVIESRAEDISVVSQALDGQEAVEKAELFRPDIILMDVRMPKMDGVQAARIIHERFPEIKIVMFTTFKDDEYVKKALSYGAIGYLLKNRPPLELINSLYAVQSGVMQLDPDAAASLIINHSQKPSYSEDTLKRYKSLTSREKETLALLLKAYSNKDIADQLNIQEQSVRNYIHLIYSKLGVSNRTEIFRIMESLKYFVDSGF
jgi:DNA-binding NarL/FixJ family response regulator